MYDAKFNPFAQNIAVVKEYFKKIPVLLLAIFQFLGTVLSVGVVIAVPTWITSFVSNMLAQTGGSVDPETQEMITNYMNFSSSSSFFMNIPSLFIGILVAVAFLLIFLKSRSKNVNASPKAGVMILFVLSVIELVSTVIISVFLLLIGLGVFVGSATASSSSSSLNTENYTIAGLAVLLSLAVVIFMILFYSINKLRYYKSVKNSCSSIDLFSNGAGAYGVMNIILSVFVFFSMAGAVLSAILLDLFDDYLTHMLGYSLLAHSDKGAGVRVLLLTAAVMLLSFVFLVLEASVALGYRKYIRRIKFGYTPVDVPEAPYQPQAAPLQYSDQGYPAPPTDAVPRQNTPPSYSQTSVCPACKAPIDAGAVFCPSCGHRLR